MPFRCSPAAFQAQILASLLQVPAQAACEAIRAYLSVESLQEAICDGLLPNLSGISRLAWERAVEKACRIQEQAQRLDVAMLCPLDASYPSLLAGIPDPPLVLYIKGTLHPEKPHLACVGTRKPTRSGRNAAWRLAAAAAKGGVVVVSGLALGIDAIAHEQALYHQSSTVAVLPCSLDQVYPRQHESLAAQIIEEGGALVSEVPFGVSLERRLFVRRNRIQSGLSHATLFVQGAYHSGSMHTARFALSQQRPLWVWEPGSVDKSKWQSSGNMHLLERSIQESAIIAIPSVALFQNNLRKLPGYKPARFISHPLIQRAS